MVALFFALVLQLNVFVYLNKLPVVQKKLSWKFVHGTMIHTDVTETVLYKRAAFVFSIARMSLGGPGCRLQTCSCLAAEWFNSTFRALIGSRSFEIQSRHSTLLSVGSNIFTKHRPAQRFSILLDNSPNYRSNNMPSISGRHSFT